MKRATLFNNIRNRMKNVTKLQTAILATGGVILFAIILWIFIPRTNSNITHVTADTPTPVSTKFMDSAASAFLSSDNIPDINNNRKLSDIDTLNIYYRLESGPYTDVFKPNLIKNILTVKTRTRTTTFLPFINTNRIKVNM